MASKLEITFNSGATALSQSIILDGDSLELSYVGTRDGKGKVTTATTSEQQAVEFRNAFELDYNRMGDFTVTLNESILTIEHPESSALGNYDEADNSMTNITVVLTVEADRTPVIISRAYSEAATNKCDTITCTVTINQTVDALKIEQKRTENGSLQTYEVYNNATFNNTTVDVTLDRAKFIIWVYATIDGVEYIDKNFSPPKLLIQDVDVQEGDTGGIITIDTNSFEGTESNQYAISGTQLSDVTAYDYRSSNVFGGITQGDYQAIAKDPYGCVRIEPFTVTGEGTAVFMPRTLSVSMRNSIPFFSRTINNNRLTANNYNFNYAELPHPVSANGFTMPFAKSQDTTVQFRSNYPFNFVKVFECNGAEGFSEFVGIDVVKKTDNIQRNSFLQGNLSYSAQYGRLAVSFVPADVYDSNGNVIDQHDFDGTLPDYYEIGTRLVVDGQYTQIFLFQEIDGIRYAITQLTTNTTQTGVTIESTHLALPTEDYEFEVDFSLIESDEFYLTIDGHETQNGNSFNNWTSPIIRIVPDNEFSAGNYHVVEYWSDLEDADINYATGIRHLRNIEYTTPLLPQSVGEVSTERLDNEFVKLSGEFGDVMKTGFNIVPTMYGLSLMKIFDVSKYMVIDNMACTSIQNAEIDHKGQNCIVTTQLGIYSINQGGEGTLTGALSGEGYYPIVP